MKRKVTTNARSTRRTTKATATTKAAAPAIDRDKLRAAIRRLGDESVFYMLDEAIDLLPPAKLAQIVGRHLDVKSLRPDSLGTKSLLDDVRAFETACHAGTYYESFNVNSKNFMDKSPGTRAFIADCNRHLDRCVRQVSKGDAAEIGEAIEVVLGLLRHIDEGRDDVVFFADEAGSWQVGVDWAKVLPALFLCLARTTDPDEYARRVAAVVDEFDKFGAMTHLAVARRLGTVAQRKAMQENVRAL